MTAGLARAIILGALFGTGILMILAAGMGVATAEIPEPSECRLLALAGENVEIYRCTGAGFAAFCYVSVSELKGMAGGSQSSISCR